MAVPMALSFSPFHDHMCTQKLPLASTASSLRHFYLILFLVHQLAARPQKASGSFWEQQVPYPRRTENDCTARSYYDPGPDSGASDPLRLGVGQLWSLSLHRSLLMPGLRGCTPHHSKKGAPNPLPRCRQLLQLLRNSAQLLRQSTEHVADIL